MDDTLGVQVGNTRDELSEEARGVALLEVAVGEDVVEELSAWSRGASAKSTARSSVREHT